MIMTLMIQVIASFCAAIGFGIIIDVPKEALGYCGITGMVGWIVTWGLGIYGFNQTIAIFIGSAGVSLLSLQFAKRIKTPTTVFNIPAIFVLVPGIMAYQTVKAFISGKYMVGLELLMKTFGLSVTIAIAIVITEALYRFCVRKWGT